MDEADSKGDDRMNNIAYLDVPFEERKKASFLGAKYDSKKKSWYATTDSQGYDELIKYYGSVDFTLQRWLEDDANKIRKPIQAGNTVYKPKPHQIVAGRRILESWKHGSQGFLIADGTGTGKTISTLYGASLIAKSMHKTPMNPMKVLIVCPKAVIPSWRQTLRSYPQAVILRPLIINYQSLNKLISAPESAAKAKSVRVKNRRTARSGKPRIKFDLIIFD